MENDNPGSRFRAELAAILRCLTCGHALKSDGSGGYVCPDCGRIYAQKDGVACFVESGAYADSFGFQWHLYNRTQLDDEQCHESESDFRKRTGFTPEGLQGKLVLDVGCGPGQIAEMLKDMGIRSYAGFDFSPKRIEWAQANSPQFRFELADAYSTTLFDDVPYDAVVCTEFLEHVDRDLAVLERIRPGTRFLGTVPDFGGGSHVRFFRSSEEVEERYSAVFDPLEVSTFVRPGGQSRQFLIDGVTSP